MICQKKIEMIYIYTLVADEENFISYRIINTEQIKYTKCVHFDEEKNDICVW